ncbi:MAG: hypothetical protein LIV24_02995 [Eubacterium sp.]|nr:hypothetical protein [Eubacterium sp.]
MNKHSGFGGFMTVVGCVLLAVALGALLAFSNMKQEENTKNLETKAQQAMAQDSNNSYQTTVASSSASQAAPEDAGTTSSSSTASVSSDSESVAVVSTSSASADKKDAQTTYTAISVRGDSYMDDDADKANGYPAKLQALLQADGSAVTAEDDTWDMAGTLSQMSLAGVPDSTVQGYISEHNQEGLTSNYELIVRNDLAKYKKDRTDQGDLPVLTMGYHGGWGDDLDELIEQEKAVLATYTNGSKDYLVLGSYPADWTDHTAYDQAMTQAFGDHYVSLNATVPNSLMTEEGRQGIAQIVFNKLKELKYI